MVTSARALLRSPIVRVLGLGVLSEIVYLLYFLRHFPLLRYYTGDTDLGSITGHSYGGFAQFTLSVGLLFTLFVLGWWSVDGRQGKRLLVAVLGMAAVFDATAVFVYPITAIDIYAYVAQSQLLVHYHQNPIFTAPAAYAGIDPIMHLADGWTGATSPYGPLAMVIDALPAAVVGHDLLLNLVLLKGLFCAIALLDAYVVHGMLVRRAPDKAVAGALLVAWSPLVVIEVGINGHNDIAMMLFALLGISSLLADELTLGPVLLTASVLVKFATILLLPLALVYALTRKPAWRERVVYLATTILACLGLAALAYLPFWGGPGTITAVLSQDQRYLSSFSSVVAGLFFPAITAQTASVAGKAVFGLAYVVTLTAAATRDRDRFVAAVVGAMLAFLAFGLTNMESWYLLWAVLPAAACTSAIVRGASVLASLGAVLLASFYGFLWVWYGLSAAGLVVADREAWMLTFVPAGLLMLAYALRKRSIGEAGISRPEVPASPAAIEP